MKELRGKLAYLQGFAEGVKLDQESNEGKLFMAMLDTLNEIVAVVEDMLESQMEMDNYLELLDEDLGALEADIYGDEDEEDEYEEEDVEDEEDEDEEEEEEEEEENMLEVSCPHCFSIINLEPDVLEEEGKLEITCPNCDKVISVDSEDIEMQEEQDESEEQ